MVNFYTLHIIGHYINTLHFTTINTEKLTAGKLLYSTGLITCIMRKHNAAGDKTIIFGDQGLLLQQN